MQNVTTSAYPPHEGELDLVGPGPEFNLNLRQLWAAVKRHRTTISGIIGGTTALGVASIFLMPKIYEARASIQIEQQSEKVLGTEDTLPTTNPQDADRFLQTQVDIIHSRALAKRVADSLDLFKSDEFLLAVGSKADGFALPNDRNNQILDQLQHGLEVDLPRNSRVVGLLFRSRNGQMSAKIANGYANAFIEANIQRKFSTSSYSRDFLSNQLAIAKGRLEQSERTLIGYSRAAQLIDASAGAKSESGNDPKSLITANLVQLNEAYAQATALRSQAEERWKQAQGVPAMSLPEVLSNPALQGLLEKRAELNADINQLTQRLKPDHPSVLQAMAQITELDRQTAMLAGSIRASIKNQYETAARQQRAISAQVAALKSATLSEQDRGVEYNILRREVDTNRQLYESLLQRFKEISAEAGVTSNNVTVVDIAEKPAKPSSPRPMLNMLLAVFVGFGLAVIYIIAREHLDDTIRDPKDVETKLGLPLLGVIPVTDSDPIGELDEPRSTTSEAYYSARAAIELSSNKGLVKNLLVTSSSQAEGKSTTSYALARTFAQLGHKVLLIDADMRRPSLHHVFGLKQDERGLSSVLAQKVQPADAIRETSVENLSFIPSGPIPPNPAVLFAGEAISGLFADMSNMFDLVVVDAPPVLALADSTELAALAEATVFVVEAASAHFGQAKNAAGRLARSGGNIIGCIVTKYNAKSLGYGADGYYYYDYSYGK